MDELHELGPRSLIGEEDASHTRRQGPAVLLLNSAHHHAEVRRLDDHADSERRQNIVKRVRNLGGEPLLDLKSSRKDFDNSGEFAETDDTSVGDVRNVRSTEERQQVMLAEAVDVDIANDDHLGIGVGERSTIDHPGHIVLVPGSETLQRSDDALGGASQAFACGVLTKEAKQPLDQVSRLGHLQWRTRRVHGHAAAGVLARAWVIRLTRVRCAIFGQRRPTQRSAAANFSSTWPPRARMSNVG